MRTDPHGGKCCGMLHVYHFIGEPTEKKIGALEAIIKDIQLKAPYWDMHEGEPTGKRAVEVCLTDKQLFDKGWGKVLKELGFIRTVRWKNPNSNNHVNQLVLCDDVSDEAPY